jgi:hypothetical protein
MIYLLSSIVVGQRPAPFHVYFSISHQHTLPRLNPDILSKLFSNIFKHLRPSVEKEVRIIIKKYIKLNLGDKRICWIHLIHLLLTSMVSFVSHFVVPRTANAFQIHKKPFASCLIYLISNLLEIYVMIHKKYNVSFRKSCGVRKNYAKKFY